MIIASQPLFYLALGFTGMLLCAWLFDRAYERYMPVGDEESQPAKPALPRALLYTVGALGLAIALLLALNKTSLLVADLLLLAVLTGFAVGAYRTRLHPLLARGLPTLHLAGLVVALGLWVVSFLWFMHLHLAVAYGAA